MSTSDPVRMDKPLEAEVISSTLPDGASTSAKQDTLLTELQLKANLTETQPVHESGVVTTTRADNWYNDAFQWQRVSQKNKRFDYDFHAGKNSLLWDEVGNGAVTFNANARDVTLSIPGTGVNDKQSLIQHYYNIYTPLYSQLIAETGVLNGANLAGTARAFLRSTVTGTTTEEYVAITDESIDLSKSIIFAMDFQSLRVGTVRFALDMDGHIFELGEIRNDNERATGYWQTPNLPIHYRIYNTATNTISEICYGDAYNAIGFQFVSTLNASQTCRAICSGVASEGGGNLLDIDGFPFVTPRNATVTVSTSLIPLLSIRPSATFNSLTNHGLIIPTITSIQTDNPIEWVLLYRPTLIDASFAPINSTYHGVDYDIAASAITGGIMIDHDVLSAGNNGVARVNNALGKIIMSLGSNGTADILALAAIRTGASNASVRSILKGYELR